MRKKIELEFNLNISSNMLYNYISSPSYLSEWFADNVRIYGNAYSFYWSDNKEVAILIKSKQDNYVRFQWEEDKNSKYYFEFLINTDELTGDVYLNIIDFPNINEIEDSKMWWENQINRLRKIIGN